MKEDAIDALKKLTGRGSVVLTGRAAAGIWAALRVMGFRDQWVLIPANTCYIVLWAVIQSGNKPYLIDIDPLTGNISLEKLAHLEIERPAAMIPCHMYGVGAPMALLCEWAKARGVFVIEDAALALGGEVRGKPAGAWGDASILSFGHGKIVDAGIGGALLADDARFVAEAGRVLGEIDVWDEERASLTDQWNQIYWALHQFEDENPRLAALYPALFEMYGGLVKYGLPGFYPSPPAPQSGRAPHPPAPSPSRGEGEKSQYGRSGELDDYAGEIARGVRDVGANVAHRRRMAAVYDAILESCPAWTLPRAEGEVLWRYPLMVSRSHRNNLLRHLWEQGFTDMTRWYPSLRPMFAALCPHLAVPSTPNADRFGAEIINLRVDMGVDEAMVRRVVGAVRGYFGG